MLDILDVCVSSAVEVGREAASEGELVVDCACPVTSAVILHDTIRCPDMIGKVWGQL